jgi:hypothetical protein
MPKTIIKTVAKTTQEIPETALAQHQARAAAAQVIARRRLVKVLKPSKRAGRIALVTWPAAEHPVTPEVAEAMAEAIKQIAKVARDLNIPKRDWFDPYNSQGYYGR